MRTEPQPIRREPATLVTGSGRCGTGWLAAVLNHAGVNAGHESWWTLGERHYGLDVDVSWLGCFDRGYTGRVLAQVRDPRTCIPSIYANEHRHQYHLIRSQNVILSGDWAVDACRIWVAYTEQAVERAELHWRVEDVDAVDLMVAFDLDAERITEAVETVPRNINARPAAEFTWPDDPIVTEVAGLAKTLGYEWTSPASS